MNEEKELPEEELIHDLEEFASDKDMNETGLYTKILAFIHHLQGENKRLTEENEGRFHYESHLLSMNDNLNDEIAELQKQVYEKDKEIERYKTVNKLLEQDVEDLHKEREKRVEEVYADFMQDYKIMRDELNECYDENERLREALRSIPQAICDNTYPDFDKAGKPVNVWKAREGYDKIDEIIKAVNV